MRKMTKWLGLAAICLGIALSVASPATACDGGQKNTDSQSSSTSNPDAGK